MTNMSEAELVFKYDPTVDNLYIRSVPQSVRDIILYTDDPNVAFLVSEETEEVIGFQIEGFFNSFLSRLLTKGEARYIISEEDADDEWL